MATLRIENLYKTYENTKKNKSKDIYYAVNDLNLTCKEGEFIGILGPSGCGKTTTLRMIAGLESITDGAIYIDDVKINDLHPKDRDIGLAFENYALYPPLNVYENIAFNLQAHKKTEKEVEEAVRHIAPLLKIEDLLDKMPVNLGGGQKQRVNIARAVIRRPKVLLLDEPLSHLDSKMRQQLRAEIKRLHREIKCTSVYVTHDQIEAMSLADRIAIMNFGVLQQFGTPQEIYSDPANEFVAGFIGEPPMNIMPVTIEKHEDTYFFAFDDSEIKIKVPNSFYSVISDGMRVKLGVRPADVIIEEKDDSVGSPVTVAVFENLGDERKISFEVGKDYLNLTTLNKKRYRKGDKVRISFHEERTYLFNIENGERIRT